MVDPSIYFKSSPSPSSHRLMITTLLALYFLYLPSDGLDSLLSSWHVFSTIVQLSSLGKFDAVHDCAASQERGRQAQEKWGNDFQFRVDDQIAK